MPQIVGKLNRFLSERPRIKEEFEVVYLLVELRKLLDRKRVNGPSIDYSLVRFHADWALHTEKEHINSAMKKVMNNIESSVDVRNINFIFMPEFRKELVQLLTEHDLPNEFCKNDNDWIVFVTTMTQVLADQPIIDPTPNISEFRYVDVNREGIMATINFKGTKAGKSITLGFGL